MVASINPVNPVIAINQKYKIAKRLWLVVNIQSDKNTPMRDKDKASSRRKFQKKITRLILDQVVNSDALNFKSAELSQPVIFALKNIISSSLGVNLTSQLTVHHK